MKTKIKSIAVLTLALIARSATCGLLYTIPATSDLWLAGMPNGSTASVDDSAPAESPLAVTGITIAGGLSYSFLQVSGTANDGPTTTTTGPEGDATLIVNHWTGILVSGSQNGIANMNCPANALIGVFLGSTQPNLNPTPSSLDFTTSASRDYLTLAPALQQPFFIGDGQTSLGVVQNVTAPNGATQLFIGTMDEYEWSNNQGQFTLQIAAVPEPRVASLATLGISIMAVLWVNKKRKMDGIGA